MKLIESMARGGFEQVIAVSDPSSGLAGFVVIHDTSRGPATGGIRLYPYRSEEDALADGLDLARAMTFKAAAADLPVGGGKIVLMEGPALDRERALRGVGRLIESLGGRFLAGRDVGVSVEQGGWVRRETRFMVDETDAGVGDLNRATALGVEAGARAALRFHTGAESWSGVRVAIQGVGGVGRWLARMLHAEGAELVVSEPRPEALEILARDVRVRDVGVEEIYSASRDVFSPCAIGGVLNEKTVERLNARVVAGSANNLLAEPRIGRLLFERGITYAPDFLINAGALIQGVRFLLAGERESLGAIRRIERQTRELLERARRAAEPPEAVLERETRETLAADRDWQRWHWPKPMV